MTSKAVESIDWGAFENRLFELSKVEIAAFAQAHADETFYGFGFDCNADYGQVFLCLNTQDDLRATAESSKERYPNRYKTKSVEEIENRLRWNMEDWKYQDFASESFGDGWNEFEDLIIDNAFADDDPDRELQAHFLSSVCRVATRLQKENVFQSLNRTPDFRVFVADHDEPEETSWNRLKTVMERQ